MEDYESMGDLSLGIRTAGRDDTGADEYHHPYEPTPYAVLARLADSGWIGSEDTVLDYGCGKGRVGFFLARQTGAKVIGIEYDARIFERALENQKTAGTGMKADFVLTRAEAYTLPEEINRCYFFNPFSVEILQKVMARILESWYEHPRQLFLFFYYPADEYLAYLMTVEELDFYDEITCDDLFAGKDARERILIFELPDYGNGIYRF